MEGRSEPDQDAAAVVWRWSHERKVIASEEGEKLEGHPSGTSVAGVGELGVGVR